MYLSSAHAAWTAQACTYGNSLWELHQQRAICQQEQGGQGLQAGRRLGSVEQQQQQPTAGGQDLASAQRLGSFGAAGRSARATPPPWTLGGPGALDGAGSHSFSHTLSAVEERGSSDEEGEGTPPGDAPRDNGARG